MSWLDTLVSWFASFSNTAAEWSYNSTTWNWPLNILSGFFVALSWIADGMFTGMFDFRAWLYQLVDNLDEVFSWQAVIDWIKARLDDLAGIAAWFSDWWYQVQTVIDWYWSVVSDQVHNWIATATEDLPGLLAAWNEFFTNTLPTLFDLSYAEDWWKEKIGDIGDLIGSAFVERADLWAGWTDFRQAVSDIVTAPFDWLEARFTDWFLGRE